LFFESTSNSSSIDENKKAAGLPAAFPQTVVNCLFFFVF
jgi:hypothetical protein